MTNWFSSTFLPFNLSMQACVSYSIFSIFTVKVVRTLLDVLLPVAVSFWTWTIKICISRKWNYIEIVTFRIVLAWTTSPMVIKLYACHISSDSSGISLIELQKVSCFLMFWFRGTRFSSSTPNSLTHCPFLHFYILASYLLVTIVSNSRWITWLWLSFLWNILIHWKLLCCGHTSRNFWISPDRYESLTNRVFYRFSDFGFPGF